MANLDRLETHDLELGATEAVQKHMSRHVVATKPVSQRKLDFEHKRPRFLRECMAEATGVFFYVYASLHAWRSSPFLFLVVIFILVFVFFLFVPSFLPTPGNAPLS